VVGRRGLLAQYRRSSPHTASIVGEVPTWGSMMSKAAVAKSAAPLVRAYREQHTAKYLEALKAAEREGSIVWGLEKVWESVAAGQVQRVWVERDYWTPGRLADKGRHVVTAVSEAPGVIADVVDMLIERAALAGAHVEMVEHMGNSASHRIAAQLGQPQADDELLVLPPAAAPQIVGAVTNAAHDGALTL
jgi:Bacterial archaeo-eukaryotic release factor family 3